MKKQIKTLIKYQKESNEIIEIHPIFEGEEIIIEKNYVLIGTKETLKPYLKGEIEDSELSEAPFGLSYNEYFKIIDGIIEW